MSNYQVGAPSPAVVDGEKRYYYPSAMNGPLTCEQWGEWGVNAILASDTLLPDIGNTKRLDDLGKEYTHSPYHSLQSVYDEAFENRQCPLIVGVDILVEDTGEYLLDKAKYEKEILMRQQSIGAKENNSVFRTDDTDYIDDRIIGKVIKVDLESTVSNLCQKSVTIAEGSCSLWVKEPFNKGIKFESVTGLNSVDLSYVRGVTIGLDHMIAQAYVQANLDIEAAETVLDVEAINLILLPFNDLVGTYSNHWDFYTHINGKHVLATVATQPLLISGFFDPDLGIPVITVNENPILPEEQEKIDEKIQEMKIDAVFAEIELIKANPELLATFKELLKD